MDPISTKAWLKNLDYKDKKILVINDYQLAIFLAINNTVTYVTSHRDSYEMFNSYVIDNPAFGKDDISILVDDKYSNLDLTMHFDYIIGNPPYDRQLHLKILEKVSKLSKNIIWLSPCGTYTSNRLIYAPNMIKSFDRYAKMLQHLVKNDVISNDEFEVIFGQRGQTDMSIQIYDMDYVNEDYTRFVNFENVDLIKKCMDKCLSNSWRKHLSENTDNRPYILNISPIHGMKGKPDFYNIECLTYESQLKCEYIDYVSCRGRHIKSHQFKFNSETERHNFYDAYMTKTIVWLNTLWKKDTNVYTNYIPYFGDYTHVWTDEDVMNWLGLSEEEKARLRCLI